jgi:hypothetical protein
MTDDKRRHQSVNIVEQHYSFFEQGALCWNCELSFRSWEDAPPDCPLYFCSPQCCEEWESEQPMQNFLHKRRLKRK